MEEEVVSLQSLFVPEKQTEIDFPGMEGFKLNICFLSREAGQKLVKKHTVTKYDRKSHQPFDHLDEESFVPAYLEKTLKGWSGLKYRYLEELLPVDIGDKDLDSELPYTKENAIFLVKESETFENWISEAIRDLSNFTQDR